MDLSGSNTALLVKLLSASSMRSRVIAGNVANQNTPGFDRRVVRFEDAVREALERGGDTGGLTPVVEADQLTPSGPDGNNVTLELELNSSRENRLMYETYATILESHFRLLQAGITGGR